VASHRGFGVWLGMMRACACRRNRRRPAARLAFARYCKWLHLKKPLSSDDGDRLVGPAHLAALRGHTTQVTPHAAAPAPHSRTRLAHALPTSPAARSDACHNLHIFSHTLANKQQRCNYAMDTVHERTVLQQDVHNARINSKSTRSRPPHATRIISEQDIRNTQ
jgi:hypothetical protein